MSQGGSIKDAEVQGAISNGSEEEDKYEGDVNQGSDGIMGFFKKTFSSVKKTFESTFN